MWIHCFEYFKDKGGVRPGAMGLMYQGPQTEETTVARHQEARHFILMQIGEHCLNNNIDLIKCNEWSKMDANSKKKAAGALWPYKTIIHPCLKSLEFSYFSEFWAKSGYGFRLEAALGIWDHGAEVSGPDHWGPDVKTPLLTLAWSILSEVCYETWY